MDADWYAVGVILYQALTGQLPFTSSLAQILLGKQQRAPAPPRSLCPEIPDDLEALCLALLSRDPGTRAGYAWRPRSPASARESSWEARRGAPSARRPWPR
jgi:eukaryotic-like serine/threonine-protein kinase